MGYTTTFIGKINIEPVLNAEEIDYLNKFSGTRRMNRIKGPYYVDNAGMAGQDHEEDILNYNQPPDGQPGLWCQWVPTEDGSALVWDEVEKFYDAAEWMKYLIEHFLKPGPIAKSIEPDRFTFLRGHTLSGVIEAQGEESDDRWDLVVADNKVMTRQYHFIPEEDCTDV